MVAAAPTPAEPGAPLDATALRQLWPEVLDVVKQASRRTRALLDNAQIASVTGELVGLTAPGKLAKMIAEDSNTAVLRSALTKVVGGQWKIAVASADTPGEAGPALPGARVAPPPEPEPDPDPRDVSEAADVSPPVDPETQALNLLRQELGARPLEAS